MVFTKFRPFEEWGKFDWDIKIGEEEKEEEYIPDVVPDLIAIPDKTDDVVDGNLKKCGFCTLDNDINLTYCEACGNSL